MKPVRSLELCLCLAGAIANFLLALFVFVIVALIGTPQVTGSGVGIIAVEPNSVFANVGLENGDIIIEVNGEKFETVQEVLEAYYRSKSEVVLSVQKRETGDLLDIVVPPSDQGTQLALTSFVQIQQVVSGSPADKAGMKPGDLVFAFDATPIDSVDEFRIKTKENTGREITLSIQRESQNFKITLTPRENPPEGQGAMGVVISSNIVQHDSNVGLTFLAVGRIEYVPLPLNQALRYSGDRVSSVIVNTVRIPGQLISGAISPQEARPVSVLGMSQIGAVFLQESIEQKRVTPILEFIATISVALGFFNLLPIPALDGGRIVFVLVEIVRGKPITAEREGLVHLIGLALLLSLSVLIFINDLIHPVIDQIR
ncbi:MAG: RIP metalloprotease RseP [Anaerolineae bacterium]